MENADVSIILVNYNGCKDTIECYDSLIQINYSNYHIVIVDNCSTEDIEILYEKCPKAQIIRAEQNNGFSAGNNIGIEYAKRKYNSDFYLLINNDTVVDQDFLSSLVDTSMHYNDKAIVAGKIYYYSNHNKIWSAGGDYFRKSGLTIQYSGIENGQFNQRKEITFATGCLLLIPKDILSNVGNLDEQYFLYCEDTDYCQRALDGGYKIIYEPNAVIYHKISASVKYKSFNQEYYMIRNNYFIAKEYGTGISSIIQLSYFYAKQIVKRKINIKAFLKGYNDYRRGITGKL